MKSKTAKSRAMDEPGVTEVRRWRAGLWVEGGASLRSVTAMLRAAQAEAAASGATILTHKSPASATKRRIKRRAA